MPITFQSVQTGEWRGTHYSASAFDESGNGFKLEANEGFLFGDPNRSGVQYGTITVTHNGFTRAFNIDTPQAIQLYNAIHAESIDAAGLNTFVEEFLFNDYIDQGLNQVNYSNGDSDYRISFTSGSAASPITSLTIRDMNGGTVVPITATYIIPKGTERGILESIINSDGDIDALLASMAAKDFEAVTEYFSANTDVTVTPGDDNRYMRLNAPVVASPTSGNVPLNSHDETTNVSDSITTWFSDSANITALNNFFHDYTAPPALEGETAEERMERVLEDLCDKMRGKPELANCPLLDLNDPVRAAAILSHRDDITLPEYFTNDASTEFQAVLVDKGYNSFDASMAGLDMPLDAYTAQTAAADSVAISQEDVNNRIAQIDQEDKASISEKLGEIFSPEHIDQVGGLGNALSEFVNWLVNNHFGMTGDASGLDGDQILNHLREQGVDLSAADRAANSAQSTELTQDIIDQLAESLPAGYARDVFLYRIVEGVNLRDDMVGRATTVDELLRRIEFAGTPPSQHGIGLYGREVASRLINQLNEVASPSGGATVNSFASDMNGTLLGAYAEQLADHGMPPSDIDYIIFQLGNFPHASLTSAQGIQSAVAEFAAIPGAMSGTSAAIAMASANALGLSGAAPSNGLDVEEPTPPAVTPGLPPVPPEGPYI